MYRFKDARGFTHALEDLDALRLAIAEGQVRPATPFCEGDGAWTLARLHPAFRQIAGDGRTAHEKSFWDLKGWEITQTWPGRVVLVIVTLIGASAFNTLTGGGQPSQDERAAFHRAMTLLSEGDTAAMAGLEEPPRSKALRPAWATMMGGRDILLHMAATQRRLGLPDDVPETWMTNDHILRPSRHPEIRDHVRGHREGRPAGDEGAPGGAPGGEQDHGPSPQDGLQPRRHGPAYPRPTGALRGHLSIDYNGDIVIPYDGWLEEYNFSVAHLESLAARVDSLDKVLAERVKDDLASLTL